MSFIQLKAQVDTTLIIQAISDSFTYSAADYKKTYPFSDTMAFGTGYYDNVHTISTEIDSVKVAYDFSRKPFRQETCIKVRSSGKEQVLYVNFQESRCWFTRDYIETVTGEVSYEIPELYELANVLYALTTSSKKNASRTHKKTRYYDIVQLYFKKFKAHPLLKRLEFTDDPKGTREYYNFRDNSICFRVENGKIVPNNQYFAVWGDIKDNYFGQLLPLINDFYKKTKFNVFFTRQKPFYDSLLESVKKYMPARKMHQWLEKQFNRKFHSNRIVLSPLIWGSHGTQSFYWVSDPGDWFSEMIVFVSGDRGIGADDLLTEGQKEGIASGILFTEIDHNYSNPVSYNYVKEINSEFADREKWVKKIGDTEGYPAALDVFNEYITHGVYLLYAYDTFNNIDFEEIRKNRENLMVEQRGYIKFREFFEALLKLYKNKKPNETLKELYPAIIKTLSS